ncbi:MAG: glycoside hydrolase family 3 C-terminal domain-containing protein [Bacteroidales bacterium]
MKKCNGVTFILLLLIIVNVYSIKVQAQDLPKLGKSTVKEIISAMSLEEKARLVVGTGMIMDLPDSIVKKFPGGKNPFAPAPGSTGVGMSANLVNGSAGQTAGIERFGILQTVVADGPAGLRISPTRKNDTKTYFCTAFPIGTLLASSWDKEMVYKLGQVFGNEVHEYGVDVVLGPGLNIQRNPLCGRNFEYYSEDPFLTGKIASSIVNGIQSQGVGTSIKHFAANNQETNRNTVNTILSERALREIYLEGFRITIEEANPWTVMSSYNLINGTYASESPDLLTTILRNDWNYKGMVMTDWFGGKNAVAQMIAGNDLLMPGMGQNDVIVKAVNEGKLDIKYLDANVERILNYILKTPRFNGYKYSNAPDLKAHALLAREAAANGMVLLKNDKSSLPFDTKIKKIAAFGNASYETVIGGTGSGDVNEAYTISLADGLKNAGFTVNEPLVKIYADYIKVTRDNQPKPNNPFAMLMGAKLPVAEMPVDEALATKMAGENDIAIITIGRNAGEGQDRKEEDDFNLTKTELEAINNITKAFHAKGKKVVVVLNIGGVVETASWKNIPDAILLAWQPGQEAGNAITDVLTGKVNPSGKLTASFPLIYNDDPSAKNFPGIELPDNGPKTGGMSFGMGKPAKVVYEEGIYVGYRYFNTFNKPVSYEFGFGLSYTDFTYSNLKLSASSFKDKLLVSVDIKNTGKMAGKEVVQLYISAPAKELDKPESELKGFEKTRLLKPGESQTITFEINARQLSSFDTKTSAWQAEKGNYEVKVGASSKDIKLKAGFSLENTLVVKKETKALSPVENINELKNQK